MLAVTTEIGIQCQDLHCGYHGKSLLHHVNLTVRMGESIALLGMNGSGKSTLIKTFGGELHPVGGTLTLGSEKKSSHRFKVRNPLESARLVSTVPQEEPNPFAFTALEIVTMGRLAESRSVFDSPDEIATARSAMKRVECDHLAHRAINELSGGEKQRVYIARSIAQQTPILLMDEPTSHLDPPHQLSISRLIASLAEEGKCVVTAVHDLNQASILASRAVLIGAGQILADGPVQAVLESPDLDECFQSAFERVTTSSGRLIVIPRS